MYSVVVTTKDRPTYLLRCLESIAYSSILPYDVVVINDGGEKLDASIYSSLNINLTIVNHDDSKGANYCRNLGVSLSKEEIIFFLDDDDAVISDSFESRLMKFQESPNVGLVYTGIQIVKSNELGIVTRTVMPKTVECYEHDLLAVGNIVGSTSRVGVKKSFFYQVEGFDESLACMQDYDLWIRMASVCEFRHDNKCGVLYTIHENGQQVSSQYNKYLVAGNYLLAKHDKRFNKHKASRKFLSRLYYKVASSAAPSSLLTKLQFAAKSFFVNPNMKSLVLIFVPFFILRKTMSII
ncbi:glycosyl transferase [Vibrio hyugaensis]|uniref:Glycosyl transferase n=1 Tax=Vibrio hyugaensis TaxID=1534743 RepID=A0ABQ5Y5I0_9VIBR|nr:glycosyltransferase family A protein [Vibrio hyugaensis]GLR04706.1 glycosyl transferase [Vibrio hyugaensis]